MTRANWYARGLQSAAACALVAVCAGGFGAVAASAKAPAQPRSTYPSANALAALGLKVTWPVTASSSTVEPGSRLVVRVARTRFARHGAVAKLVYARVTRRGRLEPLEAMRLRHGRFSVRVPRVGGASYALTLRVADLRYRSVFATAAASLPATHVGVGSSSPTHTAPTSNKPTHTTTTTTTTVTPPAVTPPIGTPVGSQPPPAPSTPAPLSPCIPGPDVPAGTYSATLTVNSTTAQPGGSVPYVLQNTGTGCLEGGAAYGWQELVNGNWTDVPMVGVVFPSIAFFFDPGTAMNGQAGLPSSVTAGQYRLVIGVSEETAPTVPWTPPVAIILYSDPITVTAAPVATTPVATTPVATGVAQ